MDHTDFISSRSMYRTLMEVAEEDVGPGDLQTVFAPVIEYGSQKADYEKTCKATCLAESQVYIRKDKLTGTIDLQVVTEYVVMNEPGTPRPGMVPLGHMSVYESASQALVQRSNAQAYEGAIA